MKRIIFFARFFHRSDNIFITNGLTDEQKITDEGFTDGVFSSVISLVN